ncbi:MAG: amidoligase family protein [Roseovarius sp.]|uniref:amidoligase family protein n=1 Tax=Roseovarius sp. TaxID=1486281 RepID=UPI0032EECFC5
MLSPENSFAPLPQPETAEGGPRLTGVEIELGGLGEARCAEICARHLGGVARQVDEAIWQVEDSRIGALKVYLDTALRHADKTALRDAALSLGREVIPVEIVTDPLDRDGLIALDDLREALRQAGALGSGGGLFFGFGVHLNVQVASDRAEAIVPPLLAYALIEDWLRVANPIDQMRRVLPFAAAYPRRLVRRLIALGRGARLGHVMDAYAQEAPSRNFGLDMLPVFAWLDAGRMGSVLTSATSARPTFHFRLPDCRIDEPGWTLDSEWRRWRTVERVAADTEALAELSQGWEAAYAGVPMPRAFWAERCGAILTQRGLADAGGGPA